MATTTLALMGIPRDGQATIGDKTEAALVVRANMPMRSMGHVQMSMRSFRSIILFLIGA